MNMNCPSTLLLFVGVFLPCFCLECKAIQYRDLRHNGRSSLLEAVNIVDQVHHHRSRRDLALTNQTDCQNANVSCQDTTEKVNHRYYVSQIVKNGQGYWVDVQGNPKSKVHPYLSDGYLLRQNFKLSFQFPYYGHLLDQVMLTTGGFLYMDTYYTKLITQVQYLAPLMAYFNPHLNRDSKVLTLDDGSKLTVEWYKVYLHLNITDRPFTFQCTLHKNGTIWFAYKEIPVEVHKIPSLPYHPVKVGISDAFVIRYRNTQTGIQYRLFYIYSAINITKQSVVNNAAVIFQPQLSCVGAQSCTECIERTVETNFTCQWCPQTEKCSDGVDRHREEWVKNKCYDNAKEMSEECLRGGKQNETQGCVGAQSCTECMERTAKTNFTCQWCPRIEKCSDGMDRHREEWEKNECNKTAIKEMSEECLRGGKQIKTQGCVGAQSCTECMERTVETNFTCQWCPQTEKCSDGMDRHREEWEKNECNKTAIKEMNEECLRGGNKQGKRGGNEQGKRGGKSKDKGIGAGAIFGICLILVVVIAIAAWCVYAYRHPTSKSGLFFIEATRRPREFFRRGPGVSGKAGQADPSDVKPQVL